MAYRDIHFAILSIYLRKLFPVAPIDPASAVKLMPGTALDGGPDHRTLHSLLPGKDDPAVYHFGAQNLPWGNNRALLRQCAGRRGDLYIGSAGRRTPCQFLERRLRNREGSAVLTKSERVRQILVDSKKWDGILDRKVQFALLMPIILTTGSATIRKELYPTWIRAPAFAGPIRSRATSASDHALSTGTGRTGMENFSYSWHARDLKLDHFYERRVARETKDSGAADRRLPLSGLCGALAFSDFARLVLVR
jgi:hypothetical protein